MTRQDGYYDYHHQYYLDHKAEIIAAAKRSYQLHHDERIKYARDYRELTKARRARAQNREVK